MSSEETQVKNDLPPEENVDWEGKAREMGWAPKEQFRGDPGKWVDAKTYVERGEHFIPLLQSAKRELQGQVAQATSENADLRRQLNVANKAIEELRTEFKGNSLETAETRKNQLYDDIAAAREENDVRKELTLREELDNLNVEIRGLKTTPTKTPVEPPASTGEEWRSNPILQGFLTNNPWFGKDQEKSNMALGYMNYLNSDPESKAWTPQQKFDAVSRRIGELFPEPGNPRRNAAAKAEGGRTDTSGGGGGRSYSELPAAAKEQCDKQARQFVGRTNGKGEVKYPDVNAYRKHFVEVYFAEDWGARQMNA